MTEEDERLAHAIHSEFHGDDIVIVSAEVLLGLAAVVYGIVTGIIDLVRRRRRA